jgi:protein-tyrosine-phosphatase
MDKQRVLFLCTHNAARSQMAEALLRQHAGEQFDVI